MTDRQENKLSMYAAVIQVCTDYTLTWTPLAAFGTVFTNFTNTTQTITNTRITQESVTTGVAKDKATLRENMADLALKVGKAVVAYASVNNNNALLDKVNYSRSQLLSVRDTISADRCRVIHTEATAVLADLTDYGVDAPLLTDLDTAISDYSIAITTPRTAITTRKTSTSELKTLFAEADKILKKQMDTLMEMFKADAPTFYTNYFNARVIVDLKGSGGSGNGGDEGGDDTGGDGGSTD